MQHRVHQGRLAVVDVGDNRHISNHILHVLNPHAFARARVLADLQGRRHPLAVWRPNGAVFASPDADAQLVRQRELRIPHQQANHYRYGVCTQVSVVGEGPWS